jgi:hypothetical protein
MLERKADKYMDIELVEGLQMDSYCYKFAG